ncbi:transposase [Asaia spathodeae]|uniref:transposase n=1 Tax=Asaia spathodeae TaxID=657016 RepID=UPI00226595FB|nr:transposase [Asaia spathodeae]
MIGSLLPPERGRWARPTGDNRRFLTGGEASDYTSAEPLMAIPAATPRALLADKGYDGDRFRQSLLMRGVLPIIPPRSNRKALEHPDYRRYRDQNRIERMFGMLKQQRRIATRYDKSVLSFESFLNLAAARLLLRSFVNAAWDLERLTTHRCPFINTK